MKSDRHLCNTTHKRFFWWLKMLLCKFVRSMFSANLQSTKRVHGLILENKFNAFGIFDTAKIFKSSGLTLGSKHHYHNHFWYASGVARLRTPSFSYWVFFRFFRKILKCCIAGKCVDDNDWMHSNTEYWHFQNSSVLVWSRCTSFYQVHIYLNH